MNISSLLNTQLTRVSVVLIFTTFGFFFTKRRPAQAQVDLKIKTAASAATSVRAIASTLSNILTEPSVSTSASVRVNPHGLGAEASKLVGGGVAGRVVTEAISKIGTEFLFRTGYGVTTQPAIVRLEPAPGSDLRSLFSANDPPSSGGLATSVGLGYRFVEALSIGLGGSFTRLVASAALGDGVSVLGQLALSIAPYARYYVSFANVFEAWASLSIGYRRDIQTYERLTTNNATGRTANGKWTQEHHGIAVPIAVGIDYHPFRWLFIGPSLQYLGVFAFKGCLKAQVESTTREWCTNDSPSVLKAYSFHVLSLGLSLRIAL